MLSNPITALIVNRVVVRGPQDTNLGNIKGRSYQNFQWLLHQFWFQNRTIKLDFVSIIKINMLTHNVPLLKVEALLLEFGSAKIISTIYLFRFQQIILGENQMHHFGFFATETTGKPGLDQSRPTKIGGLREQNYNCLTRARIKMNEHQLVFIFLSLCSRFKFQKGSNESAQLASLVLIRARREESP